MFNMKQSDALYHFWDLMLLVKIKIELCFQKDVKLTLLNNFINNCGDIG